MTDSTHKRKTPMPLVGLEHMVLASKQPQTHGVGCTSSGISFQFILLSVKFSKLLSTSVFLKMMNEHFPTLYHLNLVAPDSFPSPYSASVLPAIVFIFTMLQVYFQSLVTKENFLWPRHRIHNSMDAIWHHMTVSVWRVLKLKIMLSMLFCSYRIVIDSSIELVFSENAIEVKHFPL
jgi:hypothetical protein